MSGFNCLWLAGPFPSLIRAPPRSILLLYVNWSYRRYRSLETRPLPYAAFSSFRINAEGSGLVSRLALPVVWVWFRETTTGPKCKRQSIESNRRLQSFRPSSVFAIYDGSNGKSYGHNHMPIVDYNQY